MSNTTNPRIIRWPKVQELTSLSRTSIWRLERAGKFPQRRQVGLRSVGWLLNEVENWLISCPPRELKSDL